MMTLRSSLLPILRGLAILALFSQIPAGAQETERVAAVVNDDIISLHDLEQRMRLALASSNLPDSLEARGRVGPQVLRGLIDERLKTQEATRLKINIGPGEIANGLAISSSKTTCLRGGSRPSCAAAASSWIPCVSRSRRKWPGSAWCAMSWVPDLHIGEAEIDNRLATLKANFGKPEYQVGEIFLAVDDPRRDGEIRTLAERLIDQLRQGAPFPALARQFSQNGAAGGDLGWVSEGALDEDVMKVLSKIDRGNLTPPIRTIDGYHILLLRDKRIAARAMPVNRCTTF